MEDWNEDRSYLEIDLSALSHNVKVITEAMPPRCRLMAVVKAEAYGHGGYEIAAHLNREGVRAFAVATIDEAIALRRRGIRGELLILGYTAPRRAKELAKYDLIQTLLDYDSALALNREDVPLKVHIKIDTGMHRLGFDWADEEKIRKVFSMENLKVCGAYTHLSVSDSLEIGDVEFTQRQIRRFYHTIEALEQAGYRIPKLHIQSSYGVLNYPELECDYARVGLALYGVLSSPVDQTKLQLDLRPVLSLKSRVALLRTLEAGEQAGYGRAFTVRRKTRLAVIPLGYADGYPRSLSCGKGQVLIHGKQAPIAGRICMDQLLVDVTEIPEINVGDAVTLIGRDGNREITAAMVAQMAGSISNELLSRLGRRLKTVYLGS